MILYKYCAMNIQYLKIPSNNEVYFANPYKEFNDPFDGQIPWYSAGELSGEEKDKRLEELQFKSGGRLTASGIVRFSTWNPEPMGQKLGVLCLSETGDDIVMFSHYSDGHTGFCIGFDMDKRPQNWSQLIKVRYEDAAPQIQSVENDVFGGQVQILGVKSRQWTYEQEYRVVLKDGHGLQSIPPGLISCVTLGCKMKPDDESLLFNILRSIKHVDVFRAEMRIPNFKIVRVRVSIAAT